MSKSKKMSAIPLFVHLYYAINTSIWAQAKRSANEELPDDIWTIRGYAWSIHHGARIKHRIDKDLIRLRNYWMRH